MGRNRAISPNIDSGKSYRVERIIDEVIRQGAAGESVDVAALERRHPELLPELHDQLGKLRVIQAAERAAMRPSLSDHDADGHTDLSEEQQLLEESLKGYRILERLEYGGQGVIYRAVQVATKRQVAIKVLLDGPLASDRQRLRFEREVDLVSRLRHPNIVTLYDSGVVRGRPYYAMEFVDGVPINDYLLFHRPTIRDCVKLFAEVCRAVAYAHQRGIIHRDLKPANILVDVEGRPHVLDFGLAKAFDEEFGTPGDHSVTVAGRVFGTLPYLSPEQVDGTGQEVDVRSDIYSLGVMLYQLLTDVFPYPVDGKPAEVYHNILTCEPWSLRKTRAACPPEDRLANGEISDDLERVALKALVKDKGRRYQSAVAFAADLDRYLAGEAVEAKADSSLYVLRKTIRRYRLQVAFSVALFVVVVASSLLVTAQWFKARAQRETAVMAVEVGQATLDDIITLVIESVGALAGASEVQSEILQVVQDRFEELMPLVQSDEAMDAIQARIHERLGDMAYAEGRHADASGHYQAFLRTNNDLASRDTPEYARDLDTLRAYRKLAGVATDRGHWFELAVPFGETLVARNPDALEVKHELCKTRIDYARHFHQMGHYPEAAEQSEAAISLAKRALVGNPGDSGWTRLLARAYEWNGDSRIKLGSVERGIQSLEESLRLQEGLFATKPADVKVRHETLVSCGRLATAYRDAGRLSDALRLFNKAVKIGEYLTMVDPSNAASKRDLLSIHARLVKLHLQTDDLRQAQEHGEATVALGRGLINLEPDNLDWRRMYAFAYVYRGHVRFKLKMLEQARADFLNALEIREELASSVKPNRALRVELAETYDWLGRCCAELDRTEEALAYYQESCVIRESLLRERAVTVTCVEAVVSSRINLAMCHLRRDTIEDDEAAEALLTEAKSSLEDLAVPGTPAGHSAQRASFLEAIQQNWQILETHRVQRAAGKTGEMASIDPLSSRDP